MYTQCVNSFIGDGQRCVSDGDEDGFPDVALSTCSELDTDGEVLPDYCSPDTCPAIFNLPQSDQPCNPTTGDMGSGQSAGGGAGGGAWGLWWGWGLAMAKL